MVEFGLVPALRWHIEHVAQDLRQADLDEIRAGGLPDPHQALDRSVAASYDPRTMILAGVPSAILGASEVSMPQQPAWVSTASPWLLGNNNCARHSKTLTRLSRAYIAELLERHDILLNFVYAGSATSVAWLKHLGFRIFPATPHPETGAPFHCFRMDKHVCARDGSPGSRRSSVGGV